MQSMWPARSPPPQGLLRGVVAFVALWCLAGCRSGVHGAGGPDGQYDSAADGCSVVLFTSAQPCGGTVNGSGTAPNGMFTAASIQVNLGSTDNRYRLKLLITDASGQSTLALEFPPSLQDGGSEIFFGAHQATASFYWGTCNVIPTTATVTLTSGDDPDTAFAAMSGMVSGTYSLTSNGFSLSGSFQTSYCRFDSPLNG